MKYDTFHSSFIDLDEDKSIGATSARNEIKNKFDKIKSRYSTGLKL